MKGEPRAKPSARDRYRYILFEVASPRGLARHEAIQRLRQTSGGLERVWLTRFDGDHGVLRCRRGDEAEARRLLERDLAAAGWRVRALSTSGTIAALARRFPGRVPRGH